MPTIKAREIFSDIANAIRLKRNIVDEMKPEDMAMQIGLINGGHNLTDALVNASVDLVVTEEPTKILIDFSSLPIIETGKTMTMIFSFMLWRDGNPESNQQTYVAHTLSALGRISTDYKACDVNQGYVSRASSQALTSGVVLNTNTIRNTNSLSNKIHTLGIYGSATPNTTYVGHWKGYFVIQTPNTYKYNGETITEGSFVRFE